MASKQGSELRSRTPDVSETGAGEIPPADWLRAIMEAVGNRALTVEEIQDAVGEFHPSPEQAPIERLVDVLMTEGLVKESGRAHHFELTDSGRTLRKGFVRETQ